MKYKSSDLDLQPDHWRIVTTILQQHVPQYDVWAFGSRVNNTARPYSDLDIVVMTDQPLSLDAMAALREAFSESNLPWKVDVLDWASVTASFRAVIQRNKVVIQRARR